MSSSKRKLKAKKNSPNEENVKKQIMDPKEVLSPLSYPDDVTEKITSAFRDKTDHDNDDVTFCTKPFPHWTIKNFVKDLELLKELKNDLLKLKFKHKYTDLFKFSQSEDIKNRKTHSISTFRDCLFTQFRGWLEIVLDTKMSDTIDMSCAKYNYTDFLLCHDDKVEDRQIAFIFYMVPDDWSNEDGGRLDLFNNKDGQPSDLHKSLIPSFNSLVFFEVSDTSFHQVSEVLSDSKTRLSISGWFHSTTDPHFKLFKHVETITKTQPLDLDQEVLLEWIDKRYLLPEITNDIQEEFEENSEIQLTNFLKQEMYDQLKEELLSIKERNWKEKGPINRRKLWTLKEDSLDKNGMIYKFLQLVRSGPFFKLLRVLTDLDLALLEEDDDSSFVEPPSCLVDTRLWKHGAFTILQDEQFKGEACLDCIFNIDCDAFEESERGYISYVAGEDTEELVTVYPTSNCLSLVYRDESTTRFVKYFDDKYCGDKIFFDFDMIYFEGKKENGNEE
ncbi:prolyl 3-hydroxylase OGFOD1-like [Clytia hemisphaerica]|uniref:uS12 prolyl 3-hydroxylase n=1 Tax=Clytia hemisphaerica TaxID=252671 RepID=A0A7M5ULM8_9CNID|eukprot:TCONS_00046001-protein